MKCATVRIRRGGGWTTGAFSFAGLFLVVLVGCLLSVEARAGTQLQSLDARLRTAFESSDSGSVRGPLRPLPENGYTYQGYDVAERVPRTGAYVVAVRLKKKGNAIRYPVKVKGPKEGWKIEWTPVRDYADFLTDFLESGASTKLPERFVGSRRPGRPPALPIVVREQRVASPFGTVGFDSSSSVEPPPDVGKHVARWVDSVLERDTDAASVDLYVSRSVPWRRVTSVLLAAASGGFARVRCVVRRDDDASFGVVPARAPVFGDESRPSEGSSFVVGIDAANPASIRVTVGGQLLSAPDGNCGGGTSLCPDGPPAFVEALPTLVRSNFSGGPPTISHVMVAVDASVPYADALQYVVRVPGALGIPPGQLYLGHIERKRRNRD